MCDENHCLMNEFSNERIQNYIDAVCHVLQIESDRITWWWDDETEMGNTWGACYGDDEEQTIEINCTTPRDELWEVISHELIHCMQHQNGSMREEYENVVIPGVWWRHEDGSQEFFECMAVYAYVNHPVTDEQIHQRYLNYPWEKQAYAMQGITTTKAFIYLEDNK